MEHRPGEGASKGRELAQSLWERPHEAEGQKDGISPVRESAPLFLLCIWASCVR